MNEGYRKIGDLIQLVDIRNKDLSITHLVGLTINKMFIPSVANTIGTDMTKYKIIRKNQFACSTMQVRRDKKMPVALLKEFDEAIISQAYPVFEVKNENEVLPDYLMLWFTRSEFDREACFNAVGGVRGSLEWEDFCNMELPIPSIEKQQELVVQYQSISNKIKVNELICEKLEATAQTLYRQWFVDFEFPNADGEPYSSSGGAMVFDEDLDKEIPQAWGMKSLGSITSLITDGKHGNSKDEWRSGYYFISAKDINNEVINYSNAREISRTDFTETHNRTNLKDGDTLITNSGTIGKLAYIYPNDINSRTTFQKSVAILKPISEINSLFFFQSIKFSVKDLINLAGGSTQSNLLLGDIKNFKILKPTREIENLYIEKTSGACKLSFSLKTQNVN
ncbi:restriction endonuclease subunit S [Gelidibacter salicanalis]|uniref:Restriction endonuclease subunit S n=1 Tax=Gelidibacter salicanalis TaxID=291193 RepID=A0A5C7AGM7_9FLAO|nr:restriction endonuclease subunit S [Gelidibacter salicanalis]TXE07966.1 restriction endonuclease subunit S [Gelidibacter salicanalis]